jgi:hypothetical protein
MKTVLNKSKTMVKLGVTKTRRKSRRSGLSMERCAQDRNAPKSKSTKRDTNNEHGKSLSAPRPSLITDLPIVPTYTWTQLSLGILAHSKKEKCTLDIKGKRLILSCVTLEENNLSD